MLETEEDLSRARIIKMKPLDLVDWIRQIGLTDWCVATSIYDRKLCKLFHKSFEMIAFGKSIPEISFDELKDHLLDWYGKIFKESSNV